MSNIAKKIIVPKKPHIFRIIFLYVGQGDSTLLVIPDDENYKYLLIDSNYDKSAGGIDLLKLLSDLFKQEKNEEENEEENEIEVYINTHPHADHLRGVKEIFEKINIKKIWHSGHKPSKDHIDVYKELKFVIDKLGNKNVFCLKGSSEDNKLDDKIIRLGDINYNILAPAEHVSDEIEDEKPEDRYKRIHEQCGVIRFKYGDDEKQILITGDADYDAWKNHITDYHKDRLSATVISAAHHGSNSFFWKNSDTTEKPYKDHLEKINPTYIIVSAPKQKESRHGHPDKKAMELYKEEVGEDNLFHLGKKRECIIVDIEKNGEINLYPDDELVKEYRLKSNDEDDGDDGEKLVAPAVITELDKKPMGT